jgi:hypothetical protein
VAHASIEAHTITAIAIMNQKSWWRSVPGTAFHDLRRGQVRFTAFRAQRRHDDDDRGWCYENLGQD